MDDSFLYHDFLSSLSDRNIALKELSGKESFAITKQWTSTFARDSADLPQIVGSKAVGAWLQQTEEDLILLFLSSKIGAFPLTKNSRPCSAFLYRGPKLDLSEFHELEFAVFPDSYSWTLVHTHEDGAFGGPYFIRANESITRQSEHFG